MAKLKFTIELEQPEGATISDVGWYLIDAAQTWRGSLEPPHDDHPGDPMWGLNPDKIVLRYGRRRKWYTHNDDTKEVK